MFGEGFNRQEESNLTTWAPAVDILETEHELIVKADLPDVDPKELDIRVENNILTIRGGRKFEKQVNEKNCLRVERAYGSFARSFSLANTVNSEVIKADYLKRRLDTGHSETRGSQAEADPGQRRYSGCCSRCRTQVIALNQP